MSVPAPFASMTDAVEYIYGRAWFGKKAGLKNIRALLALLGDPHKALRIVHVAGTNGKGSVCALLDAALRENGLKVGLYTSPMLESYLERIRINGQLLEEKRFLAIAAQVRQAVERMEEQGQGSPTFFEVGTAIAFCAFGQMGVQVVVLETGLGGATDATNVVEDPLVSVITSVGLDHMHVLGSDIEEIARQKAGIFKPGRPVVIAPQEASVCEILKAQATALNCPVYDADEVAVRPQHASLEGQQFWVQMPRQTTQEEFLVDLPLLGVHQQKNAATALWAMKVLEAELPGIQQEKTLAGFSKVCWPGRLEWFGEKRIMLDGAHNLPAAKSLRAALDDLLSEYALTFVLGIFADKDADGILAQLLPVAKRVICTQVSEKRALDSSVLAEKCRGQVETVIVQRDPVAALEEAVGYAQAEKGAVLVAGSLYLVGNLRSAVLKMNEGEGKVV